MDTAEAVRPGTVQAGPAAQRDAAALAARRLEPGGLGAVELLAAAGVDGGAERETILMREPQRGTGGPEQAQVVGFGLQLEHCAIHGAMTAPHFTQSQPRDIFSGRIRTYADPIMLTLVRFAPGGRRLLRRRQPQRAAERLIERAPRRGVHDRRELAAILGVGGPADPGARNRDDTALGHRETEVP